MHCCLLASAEKQTMLNMAAGNLCKVLQKLMLLLLFQDDGRTTLHGTQQRHALLMMMNGKCYYLI